MMNINRAVDLLFWCVRYSSSSQLFTVPICVCICFINMNCCVYFQLCQQRSKSGECQRSRTTAATAQWRIKKTRANLFCWQSGKLFVRIILLNVLLCEKKNQTYSCCVHGTSVWMMPSYQFSYERFKLKSIIISNRDFFVTTDLFILFFRTFFLRSVSNI